MADNVPTAPGVTLTYDAPWFQKPRPAQRVTPTKRWGGSTLFDILLALCLCFIAALTLLPRPRRAPHITWSLPACATRNGHRSTPRASANLMVPLVADFTRLKQQPLTNKPLPRQSIYAELLR